VFLASSSGLLAVYRFTKAVGLSDPVMGRRDGRRATELNWCSDLGGYLSAAAVQGKVVHLLRRCDMSDRGSVERSKQPERTNSVDLT